MKKILIVMFFLVATLSSCRSAETEITFLDVKTPLIDTDSLLFIDITIYDAANENFLDNSNNENEIINTTRRFIDYTTINYANSYGPLYPSSTLAVINLKNDDYENIQLSVYSSVADPSTIFIGIDIFDISNNEQLLYFDVYTTEFIELIELIDSE